MMTICEECYERFCFPSAVALYSHWNLHVSCPVKAALGKQWRADPDQMEELLHLAAADPSKMIPRVEAMRKTAGRKPSKPRSIERWAKRFMQSNAIEIRKLRRELVTGALQAAHGEATFFHSFLLVCARL